MNIPKPVRLWEVDGFVKLSDRARNKFERLIKDYGVRKLSRNLNFDRETVDSIYRKGRKKGAHSIKHLVEIAKDLSYDLMELEKEIIAYGRRQAHMYNISFPFILSPLHIRAVTIHGDGSFYYDKKKNSIVTEWYQSGERIIYMEKLLNKVVSGKYIKSKVKNKKDNVYYISIPSYIVRLVCKSLNLKLKDLHSIEFFKVVSQLPPKYKIQVFFQFLVDEGYLKGTTLTFSQKKQWSREGFKILLDSLNFEYSHPSNKKDDITIYNHNFPVILDYLKDAKNNFDEVAGFWFKEKEFIGACKKINPSHYPLIRKSMKANQEIFKKLERTKPIFNYQDVRNFGRTSREVSKAIRCWKKNGLIKRVDFNKYKILK